jgi:SAM-dependent methyltransferase
MSAGSADGNFPGLGLARTWRRHPVRLAGVTSDEHRQARAVSFGAVADAYERGRPPYPPEAIDWLLPAGAARVLDLGAGTGKLTRQVSDRGLDVTAVEPSEGMREQLRRVVPGVRALAGSAERIPLPGRSVDAVLVAQAWHWVDPVVAVPEVARVLRPGGLLGLLWNIRDERAGWVAELGAALRRSDGPQSASNTVSSAPPVGPPFSPVERHDVEWVHHISPDALIDMVASRSYVITLPTAGRAALLGEVRRLTQTHPALAGADDIALPYVTRCWRARLPA